jgi:hypothetical protein
VKGEQRLFVGEVHILDQVLMLFGVGLFALGAAEALKPIAVNTKALTSHVTFRATHCGNGACCLLHDSIIQRVLAVVN